MHWARPSKLGIMCSLPPQAVCKMMTIYSGFMPSD